jgi:flagellar motor switch/type III secretory pathway protein FliN
MRKELRVQLGRAWLAADDVAALGVGDEIRLDGSDEEPVSVCLGTRPLARGTMAVMDGMLCVRIVDVPAATEAAPADVPAAVTAGAR